MRVYLPSTLTALPALLRDRRVAGGAGCAVTPALREWYAAGADDVLEYSALQRAARQSLDLLADDVRAPRRRVVLAADVPDAAVHPVPGDEPAAVRIDAEIALSAVQAVHVDGEQAVPLVRAALVEPEDEMVQGDLEDADLLWYATQELDQLV